MLNNEDLWKNLQIFYSYLRTSEKFDNLYPTTFKSYHFSMDSINLTIELIQNPVILRFLDLSRSSKLILTYQGGNLFNLSGTPLNIYFTPPYCRILLHNIFDLSFPNQASKENIFNLAVTDAPWKVGSSNPTRGVTLNCPTISLKKFKTINLPLKHFPYGGLLFVWVTNHSYKAVLDWAHSLENYLVDELHWTKMYHSRKWHKSLGYILQHSKET
eukprot:snap_masked-scaffold_58-processed-gene-0.48-mRNA-1 protein AED:1.00 eAED:1.00 QI:0/-1/0/0/-1/1/1/0/214